MKDHNIGRLRLKVYDSIEELPVERYHLFNIYSLMVAGIGSDTETVNAHIAGMFEAINRKDLDRLKIQLQNYYHNLALILEGHDTKSIAFSCLVHSVNGEKVTDISEEGLKLLSQRLTRANRRAQVIELFKALKKKLRTR